MILGSCCGTFANQVTSNSFSLEKKAKSDSQSYTEFLLKDVLMHIIGVDTVDVWCYVMLYVTFCPLIVRETDCASTALSNLPDFRVGGGLFKMCIIAIHPTC